MTDEELYSIHIEGAGAFLTSNANEWTIENHQTYKRQMMHAGLRAVFNAGLTRAAEMARAFIPDMHDEGESCEDCTIIRALAAAIDAEKEKNRG